MDRVRVNCAQPTRPASRVRTCPQKTAAPHTGCVRGSGAECCPLWLRLPPRTARRDGTRGTRSRGTGRCVRRTSSDPRRASTQHAEPPPVYDVRMRNSRLAFAAATPHGQACTARDDRSGASMRDRGSRTRPHLAAYVAQATARAAAFRASRLPASPPACIVPARVASRRRPGTAGEDAEVTSCLPEETANVTAAGRCLNFLRGSESRR